MGEARDRSEGETPQAVARSEREARLAKALRDNLRRRKTPAPPADSSKPR